MMKRTMAFLVAATMLGGCTVKESEDAEGDTTYDIDPARIEVGTDTQTVQVPDVNIVPDTVTDTTAVPQ